MNNKEFDKLNELHKNLLRSANIQNAINAVNLQAQIPVPTEAMQNALAAAERMNEIVNTECNSFLSEETADALLELSADPTGLKPYIEKQIEQNDMHSEQFEHLKSALHRQIDQNDQHTEQIEQINTTLQQHRQAADEERRLREKADAEEHQFTLKWNRINLAVAIAGVLLALIALFK